MTCPFVSGKSMQHWYPMRGVSGEIHHSTFNYKRQVITKLNYLTSDTGVDLHSGQSFEITSEYTSPGWPPQVQGENPLSKYLGDQISMWWIEMKLMMKPLMVRFNSLVHILWTSLCVLGTLPVTRDALWSVCMSPICPKCDIVLLAVHFSRKMNPWRTSTVVRYQLYRHFSTMWLPLVEKLSVKNEQ